MNDPLTPALSEQCIGSAFIRFTGKHFKIEEILTFVIKICNFSTKVGFLDWVFKDFPLLVVLATDSILKPSL